MANYNDVAYNQGEEGHVQDMINLFNNTGVNNAPEGSKTVEIFDLFEYQAQFIVELNPNVDFNTAYELLLLGVDANMIAEGALAL